MVMNALFCLAAGACALAWGAAALLFARLGRARREAADLRRQVDEARRLADVCEANWTRRLEDKEEACRQRLDEKDAACARFTEGALAALREQFAHLAAEKLKTSSEGLSDLNRRRLSELMAPFQKELDDVRRAFDENRRQQIANKASFDQAIADLGRRALKIGTDAENLAKALRRESKTQGNWGELVLANILQAAGLTEGRDYLPQEQETDEAGNKLIPDVEIPLPDKEKLLIDSKASVTAYFDYVAAADDAAREAAAKAHLASVRRHMEELADKNYARRVKGATGYILMFIPNEGSYLLAMERDRTLATDAFRRHVIIVNPTTLLLCLQIVALLRSREAQNENAEKISAAAARMYEKFAVFSATFADMGKRLDGLGEAYAKARGQLCDGPANVVRQLEALKGMGVVVTKQVSGKILAAAGEEA